MVVCEVLSPDDTVQIRLHELLNDCSPISSDKSGRLVQLRWTYSKFP